MNIRIVYGTILALLLVACSSSAKVTPPDIVDTWQPPEGVAVAPPVSCEEIRGLFTYDAQASLDIQEEKRYREGGVTVIEFNYASPLGGRVPAILVVPDGDGPFAGLVFMHGSGGTRWSLLDFAKLYARLGAIAITIGAPSSRPEHNNFYPFVFREQDRREQIQLIVDLRRAIDVLLVQPGVDPQRLAYVGISYGGAMGGLLAGVEDRLKGYVLDVGDGGLVTHFSGAYVMGLPEEIRRSWLAAMWPIEPIHYVSCAAPAALLFQNGTLDTMVSPSNALRYQQAGSEPKTILWYETGHNLNKQAFHDQAEWLRGIIGIASYRMAFPFSLKIVLMVWFLLTAASLAFLARDLWYKRQAPGGAYFLWLLTIILLGPLGLTAYRISGHASREIKESGALSPSQQAIGSAAWAASGNVYGLIMVMGLLLCVNQEQESIGDILQFVMIFLMIFLLPLFTGWLIFNAAKLVSRSDIHFRINFRRPALVEIASTFVVLVSAVPTLIVLFDRFFSPWTFALGFDLSYPPLWGGFSLAALVGTMATYPFHLWMIRRGVIRWARITKI